MPFCQRCGTNIESGIRCQECAKAADAKKESRTTLVGWVLIFMAMILLMYFALLSKHPDNPDFSSPVAAVQRAPKPKPPPPPETPEQKRQKARQAREEAREHARMEEQSRILFAKVMEYKMLDFGYDCDIVASGPGHRTLTMKYILASKVIVHEINKTDVVESMQKVGFKKFILTDGYDFSWEWNL